MPASHVFALPDAMSFEAAAVFPTCWMTAAHALFDVGKLQAGETVLIHAAGSGVSTAGIQLACAAGARVLATAGSDDKCARAEQLGAAAAANNRTVDIAAWAREATGGAGVEMVFDHVGPSLWEASLFSLGVRGRLVNVGNTTGDSATIPSLGHLFHMRLQIVGSDPYRPEDPSRSPQGVFMAATMAACTTRGTAFTYEQMSTWLRDAGFTAIRLIEPIAAQQLFVATKGSYNGE
ncbi:MAG: zinc-binding dehydrogenase [Acidimicrobiia bacterium]|nr:zinc-binding dehydrogenase [Acidimicrobiia bacterium]MYJ12790.1 zinc-binding dehydrogenase [Acidimicrobiia bacterium]